MSRYDQLLTPFVEAFVTANGATTSQKVGSFSLERDFVKLGQNCRKAFEAFYEGFHNPDSELKPESPQ